MRLWLFNLYPRISGDSAIGDIGLEGRLVFFAELRLRDSFFGFGCA